MKILFTGITGFIGKPLAYKLLDEGHEIYALVRPNSDKIKDLERHDNLYLITRDINEVDVINPRALPKLDLCIHLAWAGAGPKGRMNEYLQKENVKASIALVKKCKELGIKRFIFSGSQAEYGQTLERHIKEQCSENVEETPISMYAKAKLEVARLASDLCEDYGMEYMHLRIFSVYGKDDIASSLISTCIDKIKKDESTQLSTCEQLWNYIYIKDIVDIITKLSTLSAYKIKNEAYYINRFPEIKAYKKNIINIAGRDTRVLREFVLEMEKVFSKEGLFSFDKTFETKEGIPYLNPDISKLKFLIDFEEKYKFKEAILEI